MKTVTIRGSLGATKQNKPKKEKQSKGKEKSDCTLIGEKGEIERLRQRKQGWKRMRHKHSERLSVLHCVAEARPLMVSVGTCHSGSYFGARA